MIILRKLTVLLLTHYIRDFTGSELNILDLAIEFVNLGYEVLVGTFVCCNPLKEIFEERRIRVINILQEDLPRREFNLIWSQHSPVLNHALFEQNVIAEKIIYSSLSPFEPLESPPNFVNELTLVLANSSETQKQLITEGVNPEQILIFPNSVTQYFFQKASLRVTNKELRKICIVSNHVPEELENTAELLKNHNIDCDFYGFEHDVKLVTPDLLKQYNVVITIGKTVQFSMALAIPVYCYDRFGGPGWITMDNIKKASYFNFSGRCCYRKLSSEKIVQEILNGYENCLKQKRELYDYTFELFSFSKNVAFILDTIKGKPILSVSKIINKYLNIKRTNKYYIDCFQNWQREESIYKLQKSQLESAKISYAILDYLGNQFILQNKVAAIWGSGITALNLINQCNSLKQLVKVVVDKNPCLWGKKFFDLIIQNPNYLKKNKVDIIIVASIAYVEQIIDDIAKESKIKPVTLISCKGILDVTE